MAHDSVHVGPRMTQEEKYLQYVQDYQIIISRICSYLYGANYKFKRHGHDKVSHLEAQRTINQIETQHCTCEDFEALTHIISLNTPKMSTNANSEFSNQNTETDDVVQGGDTVDNSYASRGNEPVPVMKDEQPVEQPNDRRNPDSDEALGKCYVWIHQPFPSLLSTQTYQEKSSLLIVIWSIEQDEREAIEKSNILKGDRTRHAKPTSTYQEPSDEQGLPKAVLDGTNGMSSTR